MKITLLGLCTLFAVGLTLSARADHHEDKAAPIKEAVAVIAPTKKSDGKVHGVVLFTQHKGYVQVSGEVTGLAPGEHGFHIHMFGDLRSEDGMSTGGHYNPEGKPHAGPHDKERHAGDLGNITANDEGVAKVNVKAEGLDLHLALGRGLVVHGKRDDLKSQPAGDAGPRIGVGVIGIAEVKPATAGK